MVWRRTIVHVPFVPSLRKPALLPFVLSKMLLNDVQRTRCTCRPMAKSTTTWSYWSLATTRQVFGNTCVQKSDASAAQHCNGKWLSVGIRKLDTTTGNRQNFCVGVAACCEGAAESRCFRSFESSNPSPLNHFGRKKKRQQQQQGVHFLSRQFHVESIQHGLPPQRRPSPPCVPKGSEASTPFVFFTRAVHFGRQSFCPPHSDPPFHF